MDLIDRQALLTELDRYIDAHRGYGFENVRVILRGLKREIIDFPCAQPEKRTDKRTGTHACDCISRQAVIAEFSCCELTPDGGIDANYAIDFLQQLPSAQPEINCSEFPNNSDTISRQDAVSRRRLLSDLKELITAWEKYPVMAEQIKGVEVAIGYVELIPSAQPEIIRCRNCKFASGDSRICMQFGHSPIGELDFCAWAERRTDE